MLISDKHLLHIFLMTYLSKDDNEKVGTFSFSGIFSYMFVVCFDCNVDFMVVWLYA